MDQGPLLASLAVCAAEREAGEGGGKRGRGTTTATTTAKGTGNKSASSLAECLPPPPPPFRPPSPRPSLLSPLAKVSFIFCRCFPSSYLALLPWTHTLCYIRGDYTHSHAPLPPCTTHSDRANDRARISAGVPPLDPAAVQITAETLLPRGALFVCAEGALKVVESRGRKRSRGSPPPCPRVRACMGGREGGLISYS